MGARRKSSKLRRRQVGRLLDVRGEPAHCSCEQMAAEVKKEIALEIAHVLFIDIVAYSKIATDDQRAAIEELNQLVQSTDEFRKAESENRLLKLATGDGMALIFYHSPEAPVECALEISRAIKEHPEVQLRMGKIGRASCRERVSDTV